MKTVAAVALACILVALGFGLFLTRTARQPPLLGSRPPNVRLPEVALVDDRGTPFRFSQLHGTAFALFFGYTHCRDTCPMTLSKLERARMSLSPEKRAATTVVFVTVDPSRDTPVRLHRYMALFGPGLVGVTGTQRALRALYATLGVWSVRIGKGPNYDMGHTDTVFFVDPSGRTRTIRDWQDPQQELVRDFAELTSAPAPSVPLLRVGQAVPGDQSFLNQVGRRFRWRQLRGQSVVLAFIHTRCSDANQCAATSAKFAAMQHDLPRGSRLLEVTLDPAYDRPAVLRRYGKMFGQNPRYWTLATGDPESVLEFVRRFIEVSPGRENAEREHSDALAIFDRQQHLASLTGGTDWQPDEALAEVRQTLAETNSPLDRFRLWSRNVGAAFGRVGTLCGDALAGLDASSLVPAPKNLVVSAEGPLRLPRSPVAQPSAPPHIVRIWFSTLTLEPGMWFDGTIVGSTNVASVEVRTAAFSINSTHVAPGVFRFHMRVLELPPLSRRHSYQLFVIARNTPGVQEVEQTSIRVQ